MGYYDILIYSKLAPLSCHHEHVRAETAPVHAGMAVRPQPERESRAHSI